MTPILQPAFSHRFLIHFGKLGIYTKEAANLLTRQTVSLEADLAADEYVLKIHQPACCDGDFVGLILQMCTEGFKIRVDLLDGNETVLGLFLAGPVWVKKHHASLDYASSDVLTHTLVLKRGYKPLN